MRGLHPFGASGTNFEAGPGPAQFKLRTLDAILHVQHGGLWIEVDCSVGGPWAECGVHFGGIAM
eukprot:13122634-Alexandrium_andersonii.AAC.1